MKRELTKAAKAQNLSYAFGVVKNIAYYHGWAQSPEGQKQRADMLESQMAKLKLSKKGKGKW